MNMEEEWLKLKMDLMKKKKFDEREIQIAYVCFCIGWIYGEGNERMKQMIESFEKNTQKKR